MKTRRVVLVSRPRGLRRGRFSRFWRAISRRSPRAGSASATTSSWDPWPSGPRLERHLLVKRARAQGFAIFDYFDRWEASVATLAQWVRAGKLKYEEDVLEGLEACPDALAGLYRSENRGKRVVKLMG
jgi:NADPH-dependent curcumin reductase CurA